MVAITGNDRPPPAASAISVTRPAMSLSRMPGRTIAMAATCMSTDVSTARSISATSSPVL